MNVCARAGGAGRRDGLGSRWRGAIGGTGEGPVDGVTEGGRRRPVLSATPPTTEGPRLLAGAVFIMALGLLAVELDRRGVACGHRGEQSGWAGGGGDEEEGLGEVLLWGEQR